MRKSKLYANCHIWQTTAKKRPTFAQTLADICQHSTKFAKKSHPEQTKNKTKHNKNPPDDPLETHAKNVTKKMTCVTPLRL